MQLGGNLEDRRVTTLFVFLVGLFIVILLGLTWANRRFSIDNPGGNDFLSRWVGTRIFLIEGVSPYNEQVTTAVQNLAYGRPARPNEDQILFVYPFYTIFLITPFALIPDYAMARALWMSILELSLVLNVIIMIRITRWKIPVWLLTILILFTMFWYHSVRPVINGNPSVLVALFISVTFLSIREELDALAGFLLAFSTIKPQMVILLIAFVILWAISRKRFTIIWSFLGSMALLVVSGLILEPDWILQNIRQVISYPGYTLAGTPGAIFVEWLPGVGRQLGWLSTLIFTIILLWEWRAAWKMKFKWFLWTACLTLVLTNLIGIRTATANYIAMYPALILVFSLWDQRWGRNGQILVVVSMLFLLFSLWWLFINTLIVVNQPIQHPIMFFPMPVLLLIGLYWVRWQATRSQRLFLDFHQNDNCTGDK